MKSNPPLNWVRVENAMRQSIRQGGQVLSGEDTSYLARALREDRKKYRECHARVKGQETARMQMRPMDE